MAQLFVSPLLSALSGILKDPAIQEIKLLWGVEKELEKLENTVTVIQDVLEDAEEKQFHSKAVGKWLVKLRDVAYDADDILDEVATEALLSTFKYGVQTRKKNQMISLVNSLQCSWEY
ncbi:putative disease resistance protein RGA4 isoform X2 [Tasmannia lanceolata]|uniref:putative disease resistance protein RGA4 isoform X2 n=1 Tax=Tasmannia lanceolata TaxID=3420 RepID=UPI0040641242